MRLWHKDLIPVLPRQQLLGQWRECCAIMANIAKKGTPNHVLVNKVMDYKISHFFWYAYDVKREMNRRGHKCDFSKFERNYEKHTGMQICPSPVMTEYQFTGWMNDRYLTQNYYNLQEKYDCGAITDEEWAKIEERYRELMGK